MPTKPALEVARTRNDLVQRFQATLDERVERYLEIDHQKMTPNHHFAAASAECLSLYTDGYFIGTVMMTHAIAEGIRKFVVKRNNLDLEKDMKGPDAVAKLQEDKIITPECAKAFDQIWGSYRNDVHHMRPKMATIPFRELAKRNIKDIALIEGEIFAVNVVTGGFVLVQPQYWDITEDGTTGMFLRFSP